MKTKVLPDGIDRLSFIRLTPGGISLDEAKAVLRKRGYPVDQDDDPVYIDDSPIKMQKKKRPR